MLLMQRADNNNIQASEQAVRQNVKKSTNPSEIAKKRYFITRCRPIAQKNNHCRNVCASGVIKAVDIRDVMSDRDVVHTRQFSLVELT